MSKLGAGAVLSFGGACLWIIHGIVSQEFLSVVAGTALWFLALLCVILDGINENR